jgi:hypothetical protein
MNAFEAIRTARADGVRLSVDGPSLVVKAEKPPPSRMFDLLRAHKP